MKFVIETMTQPNGADIRIDVIPETMSAYTDEDYKKGLKNSFDAFIHVTYEYGSPYTPYSLKKKLYFDNKGIYTYSKQRNPIYFWKATNIEKEYKNWTKENDRYIIPINEPRLLKNNYF